MFLTLSVFECRVVLTFTDEASWWFVLIFFSWISYFVSSIFTRKPWVTINQAFIHFFSFFLKFHGIFNGFYPCVCQWWVLYITRIWYFFCGWLNIFLAPFQFHTSLNSKYPWYQLTILFILYFWNYFSYPLALFFSCYFSRSQLGQNWSYIFLFFFCWVSVSVDIRGYYKNGMVDS